LCSAGYRFITHSFQPPSSTATFSNPGLASFCTTRAPGACRRNSIQGHFLPIRFHHGKDIQIVRSKAEVAAPALIGPAPGGTLGLFHIGCCPAARSLKDICLQPRQRPRAAPIRNNVLTRFRAENFLNSGRLKREQRVELHLHITVSIDGKYTLDIIFKKGKSAIFRLRNCPPF
jgi:hypothetical protein